MRLLLFSHGFGVRKDDRGLFTDIAVSLPNIQSTMFDYNDIDEMANTLTTAPFDEQTKKLRDIIAYTRATYPHATIDLICHSQGCVVAALLRPKDIRKIIFLAPPDHFESIDRKIEKMLQRPGAKIDKSGLVTYPRRDGSTTIIPKAYWDSRQDINPMKLYHDLAKQTDLVIVQADQDEVIGVTNFEELKNEAKIIHIATGHDFEGEARNEVASVVARELNENNMRTIDRDIVAALIFSKDSKLLMGMKDPQGGGVYADCWHIPGGGVDQDETQLEALRREILEEVGIDIALSKVTLADSQGAGETEKTLKDTGEKVTCKMQFYVYQVDVNKNAANIKTRPSDDLVKLEWVDLKQLNEYKLTPPSIALFERLGYMS